MPAWSRAHYEHVKGAGRIEADVFDPEKWVSHYYNPAFSNCLPDDGFWAAKQVMRFTEPEIRALVQTAQYTDKDAEDYLVRVLIGRQRKIGETYFKLVLPLDNFRVQDRTLRFDDLGVQYGITAQRTYSIVWSEFDNQTERGRGFPERPRGRFRATSPITSWRTSTPANPGARSRCTCGTGAAARRSSASSERRCLPPAAGPGPLTRHDAEMRFLLIGAASALTLFGTRFYDDDPLVREPPPLFVENVAPRKISDVYDFFRHTFATPGEKNTTLRKMPARDVNTVGEVLEGPWYEKRHAARRMTRAELLAGPGASKAPAAGPWLIVSAKSEGITPGFVIEDTKGRRYYLKFDPLHYPEIATAADVIGSRFFYALGYHTPENYIVTFRSSRLQLKPGAFFRDVHGRGRELTARDVFDTLARAPQTNIGEYRACASLVLAGKPLGGFRYFGTRLDDPNDIVPHEHRRSLRGLFVFAAWLGHDDSRAVNTLDTLVAENGLQYVRHHLIDFGSLFGSASDGPTSPRSGFEPLFSWGELARGFLTFGAWVPRWARVRYPDLPSVGRFSAESFDPVHWTPEYPNPAFANRLPEDTFWAAEQVMCFTNDDIRALVSTGQYSDPAAADYLVKTLAARRDAIGKAWLSKPLALSGFRIEGDRVCFDDLAVRYEYLAESPAYRYNWSVFDNETEQSTRIHDAVTLSIPSSAASFLAMEITAGNQSRRVIVYLKRTPAGYRIVGIERVL